VLNAAQTRPPDLLKGRFRAALSFWWFAYPPRQSFSIGIIGYDSHLLYAPLVEFPASGSLRCGRQKLVIDQGL